MKSSIDKVLFLVFLTCFFNCKAAIKKDTIYSQSYMIEILREVYKKSGHNVDSFVNKIDDEILFRKKVEKLELRLEVRLPEDYLMFLKITNGLVFPIDIYPDFLPMDKVFYMKDVKKSIIQVFEKYGESSDLKIFKKSLIIAGENDEQYFLLCPSDKSDGNEWEYYFYAPWLPEIEKYNGLIDYFNSILEF